MPLQSMYPGAGRGASALRSMWDREIKLKANEEMVIAADFERAGAEKVGDTMYVRILPTVTVQTLGVVLENTTTSPAPALELAERVGWVPKSCVPGLLKVITCVERGVTAAVAAEAGPVSDAALVAVTVKLYDTPLVRPFTVIGELAPTAVAPPGLAVTV